MIKPNNKMISQSIDDLIHAIDCLEEEVMVSNPTYKYAWNIGENPIIRNISLALSMNPMYFTLPVENSVKFDLDKIKTR